MNETAITEHLAETVPTAPVVTRIYLTHADTPWNVYGFGRPVKVHVARAVMEWKSGGRTLHAELGMGTGLSREEAIVSARADARLQRPGRHTVSR